MALTADQVIVELEARVADYNRKVADAERRFDRSMKGMEASIRKAERQIERSSSQIKNTLLATASIIAGAFSAREIANLVDGYTRFTNQLRVAGLEGENLGKTQESLFTIAQRYGVQLEAIGTLYSRGSQAAKDLGASEAELLRFVNGVAAGLKVQGGSAADSAGALLQLSQALGGGIVRAEEFNSVMEGARPIAQAVANGIDRFGGSVSKLRSEIADGKVTSQEFFQGFLRGSEELEAQAAQANLTIAASFTVLNNALGKYIGETDQSLSATARIGQAIQTLADNLDTIIPALGVLTVLIGARYVAAAGRAAGATIAATAATVDATIATTAFTVAHTRLAIAMGTVATAARGLLALLGGPFGIAIAGLTIAFINASNNAAELEGSLGRLEGGVGAAGQRLDEARDRAEKAGVAIDTLKTETAGAHPVMSAIATVMGQAADQADRFARSAYLAAIQAARLRSVELREDLSRAKETLRTQGPGLRGSINETVRTALGGPSSERLKAAIASGEALLRLNNEELRTLLATPPSAFEASGGSPTVVADPDKKTKAKAKKGRTGPSPEELERRFLDERDRNYAEFLRVQAELSNNARERAEAEISSIDIERNIRKRSIEADEDLTDARRQALLIQEDELANARIRLVESDDAARVAREAAELQDARFGIEADLLGLDADMARTAKGRRDIELRILDLAFQRERAQLEALAADEKASDAARQAARDRLAALPTLQAGAEAGVRQRTMSPLEAYLDSIPQSAEEMNEALESVAANGLQSVTDGLTDAIMRAKSLGDVFKSVANQIIADLLRIAIQKVVVNAIAPGLGSLLGGLPGFATGGSFVIGGNGGTDRNIMSINGRPVARVSRGENVAITPQAGNIRPVSGNVQMPRPQITVISAPQFDLRHAVTTPQLMREVDRVSKQNAVQAAAVMGQNVIKAVPGRMTQFSTDGT